MRGVLCFIGCEWGRRMTTKDVKGVTALWPSALPEHVPAPGPVVGHVDVIAEQLRRRLRAAPAT